MKKRFQNICALLNNIFVGKEIDVDVSLLIDIIKKWMERGYSPAEIMASISQNPYLSYLICLADLVNDGTIIWDEEQKIILFPINSYAVGYKAEVIKILNDC